MTRLRPRFYTDDARARVYRCLIERTSYALKAGSTVIVEATFRERCARDKIEAASGSLPFSGLWLTAATAVRADRVSSRSGDVSDATAAVASLQVEPLDIGTAWCEIDACPPIDRVASEARRVVRAEPERRLEAKA